MASGPGKALLPALVILSLAFALGLVFFYAPVEQEQGIVQKIFYIHVPLAWNAFLAFLLVFFYSFRYLTTRERRYDMRAFAAADVGVLFTTLVLITGPIWAKPVWGIWWTWDARLTLTLVLWLIYVAYLMLRHYVESPEKRATLAAVVGIIGFLDVPIVWFSIRLWRTIHPVVITKSGAQLAESVSGGLGSQITQAQSTRLGFLFILVSNVVFIYLR